MDLESSKNSFDINLLDSTPPSKRILEIDGLRGLAILGVLVFHLFGEGINYEQSHWLIGYIAYFSKIGASGVDLFFVLSGFLIGSILIDNRDSVNYFKVFYLRRVFRIFPLYYSLIIGFYALTLIGNHNIISIPEWMIGFTFSGKWYLIFAQNFLMANEGNWGSAILAPTWSLAVEEQFYLILPFLIWIIPPRKLMSSLLFLIGISVIFRNLIEIQTGSLITARILFPGCFGILLIGVLISIIIRLPKVVTFIKKNRTGLIIFTCLLILVCIFANITASPAMNSLELIITMLNPIGLVFGLIHCWILILVLVLDPSTLLRRFCRNIIFRELGELSYCVYLIHMGVYYIIHWQMGIINKPPFGLIWGIEISLTLIFTILIAKLSLHFFEKPLINYGHRFNYKQKS